MNVIIQDQAFEHSEARSAFRAFVDREIAPLAHTIHERQETPPQLIRRFAEAGYLGWSLPEAFGGGGKDWLTLGWQANDIGRACSSVRSLLTVHTMVAHTVLRWGTRQQKQKWIPKFAAGSTIGAIALTEPLVGSDAKNVESLAKRSGSDFILNGHKKWITYGQIADVFLVFAQTDDGPTAFLVERDRRGVRTAPILGMMGIRGSMTASIQFEDCRIPEDNVVGRLGLGFSHVGSVALDLGRYTVAWGAVGIIEACVDACVEYTNSREQFGVALKEHQLVRRLVTNMFTNHRAAKLLCLDAGRLRNAKDPGAIAATSIAKYFASTAAMRAADDAVQLHGANGCSSEYPLQRYLGDAKTLEIIEGSSQIQQIAIAEYAYQDNLATSRNM